MSPLASRLGRACMAAVCFTLGTLSADASAQPKSATDEARDLAKQGWAALDAENYKEALAKVIQAEALYHAPIHLLLMGNAQVGLGKLADALGTFERLAAEPIPDAAPKAFKDAQETGRKRMKELLSRVPSLLVAVENADTPATVLLDGKKTDFSNGVAVRCDPGEHTIEVTAEGFDPSKTTLKLPEKGGVVRVPIILSKPRPATSASASAGPSVTASAGTSAAPSVSATVTPEGPSRVPAYISFGVAGASLIAGAVTGGLSLSATGDLAKRCPDKLCAAGDQPAIDSANLLANVSNVTLVVGGAAAVAGIVLLTIDLGQKSPKGVSIVSMQPVLSPGGLTIRGRF